MRNERFFVWSLIFCLGLVALGLISAAIEVGRARRIRDPVSDQFLSPRRTIRRLFTSIVLMVLGVMTLFGVHFLDFSQPGIRFLAYWGIIFLLVAWLFLCAIFDISETRRIYRSRMKSLTDQAAGRARTPAKSQPSTMEKGQRPEENP